MVHVFYNRIKSDLQHDALYKHTYVHFVQQQYQVGLAQAHPNLCNKKKSESRLGCLSHSYISIMYQLFAKMENNATFILPHTDATIQISSQHKNGWDLECRKVNFLEYLGQGTLGSHTTSQLAFGHFSSPQKILIHSSQLFTLNQNTAIFNMLYKLLLFFRIS